jgi:two-component system OmpR family sensor kinase/two-component system sensor histidine kinase BaeS
MNRLWVRLTLAFTLVTLLMAAFVAGAIAWSVSRQFRGYLAQPDVFARGSSLEALQAHYERYGTWDRVEDSLRASRLPPHPNHDGGRGAPPPRNRPILVADAQGRIVFDDDGDRLGQILGANELAGALPIIASDTVAGYVLAASRDFDPVGPPELRFLNELQRSIIIVSLAALGLGAVLGLLFSRSLSKPLARLAQTAHAFAARDWSQRVPLRDTSSLSEVSEVAMAFNNMADSLQHAEMQRRSLMADVAHELRTPLTVIQGLLRALLDGVHPLRMKEVATIYDETRLLSRLVEDVRELALAEAQQLPLAMQPMDVEALLRATAKRFSAAADAQEVTLQVTVSQPLPPAQADPDRTAQILQNLVGNAFRHTSASGHVTLAAQPRERDVLISVSDTGEGIPSDDLPFVFDRFYRSDKSRARTSGGSGLGLAIARTLVEMMGGVIGIESTPGQGSRFWFTLPRSQPAHAMHSG